MKKRLYAFLSHITISMLIAALSAIVVFFFWCPAPLDEAIGVRQIFLMVLLVDVILGPLITFITYKPTPEFLKYDLPIIAICQCIMLSYGMYAVFKGRPAFIVYNNASFNVVRAVDIQPASMLKARQNHNDSAVSSWTEPRWVTTQHSSDPFLMISADAFKPIEQAKSDILQKAKPLSQLRTLYKNHSQITVLNDWSDNNVMWLPLIAEAKNMVVLVDSHSAAVLKIVNIDPSPDFNHPL